MKRFSNSTFLPASLWLRYFNFVTCEALTKRPRYSTSLQVEDAVERLDVLKARSSTLQFRSPRTHDLSFCLPLVFLYESVAEMAQEDNLRQLRGEKEGSCSRSAQQPPSRLLSFTVFGASEVEVGLAEPHALELYEGVIE